MIKLETLRVFVAVAEAGNIKDAGEQLCRTASAISMALKQLEQHLGGALFETDRKSALTPLGAFVLETGRAQIQSYDQAIEKIQGFADSRVGRLILASVPSVAANLVPALLPDFVASRPGVKVELFDLDSHNVRLFVESGQANIGISGRPANTSMVSFEPLFLDRFKLICNVDNPLANKRQPLKWSDIEGQVLIANGASEKIASREYRKLSEKASYMVPNVTSLMALAKAGLGVTLLPALSTINLPSGIVALDLEDENTERVVGLVMNRKTTSDPVTIAFRDHVRTQLPNFSASPANLRLHTSLETLN